MRLININSSSNIILSSLLTVPQISCCSMGPRGGELVMTDRAVGRTFQTIQRPDSKSVSNAMDQLEPFTPSGRAYCIPGVCV
jgi:hypothetical protein